ncbi:TetR/AcrR family transcriptional regulator [Uniformispora flossi]|uniref:TetR/AcrR family transcriptional regulator n=1 Tax=Uniformispora flossi TaxID=3390723 RepID=UPI003C2D3BE6
MATKDETGGADGAEAGAHGPAPKAAAPKDAAAKESAPKRAGGAGRRAYHHGDLRNALVEAGLQRVREGGPDAIVLREVARDTGVSSTAAYRHFESHQDLVEEVKHRGVAVMSDWVRAELAASPPAADPATEAVRHIRATGLGYVRFALAEPGLFRLIFRESKHAGSTALGETRAPVAPPAEERDPSYMVMADALDVLVAEGVLRPDRRAFTDIALWAAVHGLSTLLLETDLAKLPQEAREQTIDRLFDVLYHGILDEPVSGPDPHDLPVTRPQPPTRSG